MTSSLPRRSVVLYGMAAQTRGHKVIQQHKSMLTSNSLSSNTCLACVVTIVGRRTRSFWMFYLTLFKDREAVDVPLVQYFGLECAVAMTWPVRLEGTITVWCDPHSRNTNGSIWVTSWSSAVFVKSEIVSSDRSQSCYRLAEDINKQLESVCIGHKYT